MTWWWFLVLAPAALAGLGLICEGSIEGAFGTE